MLVGFYQSIENRLKIFTTINLNQLKILYNIGIHSYLFIIYAYSFFNKKAKLWVNGRKNIFSSLKSKINANESIIWVHCASLGEFEQGRPLIEKFKEESLKFKVLLTFFSPSGYEVRKNYAGADYVFYLPIDSTSNAEQFIEIVNPKAAFFIKYEFWYNYLTKLKENNIPTFLVSGIFRDEHYFFKWYGTWFRKKLTCFTAFFLQDETSQKLLQSIGYNNSLISGDTRFDRVADIANRVKELPLIALFKSDKKLLVAGSTWEADEELLQSLKFKVANLKLVLVPHEISEEHIQKLIQRFSSLKAVRYSEAKADTVGNYDVLVVDNVGMLSSIYQYATIAYIGGGFGKGIHNILEAAVFGIPIFFGPNYQKFQEAKDLLALNGAFSIKSSMELEKLISELFSKAEMLSQTGMTCRKYVSEKRGATQLIFENVKV